MKFKYFLFIILTNQHFLLCQADFTKGICPKVKGGIFDCRKIVNKFYKFDSQGNAVKLNILAFIPTAAELKHLNFFAYQVNSTNIDKYRAFFFCRDKKKANDKDWMQFRCDSGQLVSNHF